jgi:hypothetical protein
MLYFDYTFISFRRQAARSDALLKPAVMRHLGLRGARLDRSSCG